MIDAAPFGTSPWPPWLNAALVLIVSWLVIGLLALKSPADADVVAAVFPPWWSAHDTVEATGAASAAIVRSTALSSIVVVQPAKSDGWARLQRHGAWLALDPRAIAACLPDTKKF